MTDDDRKLVSIFMAAHDKPEGLTFSENVLAGIKAAIAAHLHMTSRDIPPEFAQVVDREFWNLLYAAPQVPASSGELDHAPATPADAAP